MAEPLRDEATAAGAMLLVTYARRLGMSLTSVDTLATASHRPEHAADAVAAYVANVLRAARAYARGAPTGPMPSAPELESPTSQTPLGAALERSVRWAGLVASATH